ncbi:MAG: hypothetical protein IJ757_07170 [Clostridiales bacterium]|nr:hypothetical protein [Clostridiales bacterium]
MSLDYSGTLSTEERQILTEITMHIICNDTVAREQEAKVLFAVNDELNSAPLPDVPMILYLSVDNSGDELWVNSMQTMADASSDGTLIQLDCGHNVHSFEYERISEDMTEFIENLGKQLESLENEEST